VLCGVARGFPRGVQEGLTPRRKGATSSGLAGAHFSSQHGLTGFLFSSSFVSFGHTAFSTSRSEAGLPKRTQKTQMLPLKTDRGGRVPERQPNSLPASRALRLCARPSPWPAGKPHATTQRRNVFSSCWCPFQFPTQPPGIPFFVFFRFFRPHRLSHVVIRSGFAEKNAKDANFRVSSRKRQTGLRQTGT